MHRPAAYFAAMQRATLRIKGGLSVEVGCILPGGGFPQLITIGASPGCDWQIQAPGVAQHAMSIGVIEGALYAASGPDSHVTLNGCPLAEAWYKVSGRATFQLGTAQLELSWNEMTQTDDSDAEVRAPEMAGVFGDSKPRPRGGGAQPPSVLEPIGGPARAAALVRLAGFLLFAAVSYFAWLIFLDHV